MLARTQMIERLFTIGVYGKNEVEFFGALERAGVTTFCDIRRRRGVRGSQYAFVNSKYLQTALAQRRIEYRYFPELAPSQEIRELQYSADAVSGISKRSRTELSEDFKRKYAHDVLANFDTRSFAAGLGESSVRVVLFCVEGTPAACHRSLVAQHLQADLNLAVEDL